MDLPRLLWNLAAKAAALIWVSCGGFCMLDALKVIVRNNYKWTRIPGNIFETSIRVNRNSVLTIEIHLVKFIQH